MKLLLLLFLLFNFLFSLNLTKKEKEFLKYNPVIYFSAMKYWPVDKNGNSIHTNYINLLNKYGKLNIQPVFYDYWSDGFNDAKNAITHGIMGLSYSKDREKYFYYTQPYNYTSYHLITTQNSKLNINNLKGKRIYIAYDSILRKVFKNSNFKIVYSKNFYKDLAEHKIDGAFVFYINKDKFLKYHLKIVKTFVDKYGLESIGINRKYPELYSIIKKVIKIIPYSEIEKIRAYDYAKKDNIKYVLNQKIELKDLISWEDVILIILLITLFFIVFYGYFKEKILHLPFKKFLFTIFSFYLLILALFSYEIIILDLYYKKIVDLKSKSFNSLYISSKLKNSLIILNKEFNRVILHKENKYKKLFLNKNIKSRDLLVLNKSLVELATKDNFTENELNYLGYINSLIEKIIILQKKVINKEISYSIYHQNFLSLLDEVNNFENIIKQENKKEINILKEKISYLIKVLIIGILLFIIDSIYLFILLRKKIYEPLNYLREIIMYKNLKKYSNNVKLEEKEFFNDELGLVINEFFMLYNNLNNTIKTLEEHQNKLEEVIKNEVEKRIYQEKILLQQSKFATMGEMLDVIAHQWKQPINGLYLRLELLKMETEDKNLLEHIDEMQKQLDQMVETMNEFRSFFRDKEKKEFYIGDVVNNVLHLMKDEIIKNKIEIIENIEINFKIYGYPNEFKHLIISIITNSRDAFIERNINDRKIIITATENQEFYYLKISDNAGGIPENIIDNIFELNITTKEGGTGVGLYIASAIARKNGGELIAQNNKEGAEFIFKKRKE